MDLTWNIYETAAANLSITEMKSFVQKELKDIQTQSRAVALHIGKSKWYFFCVQTFLWPFVFSVIFDVIQNILTAMIYIFLVNTFIFFKAEFGSFYANHNKSTIDTIQDFLRNLGMKPHMHLVEISIFSLNHVIVRPTKIIKDLRKAST